MLHMTCLMYLNVKIAYFIVVLHYFIIVLNHLQFPHDNAVVFVLSLAKWLKKILCVIIAQITKYKHLITLFYLVFKDFGVKHFILFLGSQIDDLCDFVAICIDLRHHAEVHSVRETTFQFRNIVSSEEKLLSSKCYLEPTLLETIFEEFKLLILRRLFLNVHQYFSVFCF